MRAGTLFIALFLAGNGFAALSNTPHTGTITRLVGNVTLLKNPSQVPQDAPSPRVKFEDTYYTETMAKKGDTLELGDVIQTNKVSRARLIFANGDQINVSTDTSLRIRYDENGKIKAPEIDLSRGALRAIIDPDGPRGPVKVRTRSMVLGVRGTDFFAENRTDTGLSRVTVIRGEVGVIPSGVDGEAVEVPSGYSAGVGKLDVSAASDQDDPNALVVKIEKTPPMLLAQIDKFSQMPGMIGGPGEVMVASELSKEEIVERKKLKALEDKAASTALKDIKKENPEIFEAIQNDPMKSNNPDAINKAAVKASTAKKKKVKAGTMKFYPKK